MKRVGYLFEKVVSFENLYRSAEPVFQGKNMELGVLALRLNLEIECLRLHEELSAGSWRPGPYRGFVIFEPKRRQIWASPLKDRIVHHALCNVIGPYLERPQIFDNYACRVDKGTLAALLRCQEFSRRHAYYLKSDISKYFDSVDHEVLLRQLNRKFKDRRLLNLVALILKHAPPGAPENKGIPIGNLTSQHFANFYLSELDHLVKDRLRVPAYIRYMDDFLCFSDSKAELWKALDAIRMFARENLFLDLKEKVTRVAPVSHGVPFLGFRVFRKLIRIQRPNLVRLRRKVRKRETQHLDGKLSARQLADSVQSMIAHAHWADSRRVISEMATQESLA